MVHTWRELRKVWGVRTPFGNLVLCRMSMSLIFHVIVARVHAMEQQRHHEQETRWHEQQAKYQANQEMLETERKQKLR